MTASTTQELTEKTNPQFTIQRIYVKALHFDTVETPAIFEKAWKPEVNFKMEIETKALKGNFYEVVLKLQADVKVEADEAYTANVQQAGIFELANIADDQKKPLLENYCANLLYPYARELMTEISTRGTFPPLYLTPINFDALYAQHQAQQRKAEKESDIVSKTELEKAVH